MLQTKLVLTGSARTQVRSIAYASPEECVSMVVLARARARAIHADTNKFIVVGCRPV